MAGVTARNLAKMLAATLSGADFIAGAAAGADVGAAIPALFDPSAVRPASKCASAPISAG